MSALASLRRTASAPLGRAARTASVLHHRRGYQGGLQDKDRIFTNLYNDQSPYLEAAKKRVRARPLFALSPRGYSALV